MPLGKLVRKRRQRKSSNLQFAESLLSGSRQRRNLRLEPLEERCLLAATLWTQRGGNAGHTSYADVAFDAGALTEVWSQPLGYPQSATGSWDERAVAIDESHVYRTALEGYAPSGTYHVFAYDVQSGEEVWHRTFVGNAFEGVSEPSVAGGIVYVNRAGHSGIAGGDDSERPRIYGLDAATGETVLEWRYSEQWGNNERPVISGNQLVTADGYYGGMTSLVASTLTTQWHKSGRQHMSPVAAIDDQYVYAYHDEVYRRSNGDFLGSITHPELTGVGDPMVSGSGRILFNVGGQVDGVHKAGVSAFDSDTHMHLWTTYVRARAKAVGNGVVAVASTQELVILDERTGNELQRWQAPSHLTSNEIVLTRTHAFVQSSGLGRATVHAIELSTGKEVWNFTNQVSGVARMEIAYGAGHLMLSHHQFVRAFAVGTATNRPPVAAPDAVTLDEDAQVKIAVLANDYDEDGDALSVISVGGAQNGQVVINADGSVTYTPRKDYYGPDNFIYTISDGKGGTSTSAVHLTVSSVNDAPVARDDLYRMSEDGTLTISTPGLLINDVDKEGNSLTATLVQGPEYGNLTVNPDGSFTYTPPADFYSRVFFYYVAQDDTATSNIATVAIDVMAVNDPPQALQDLVQVAEDSAPFHVDVLANDSATPDHYEALVVVEVGQAQHGSVSIAPGGAGVYYTPAANFIGDDSFTYTISDGNGGTATATVTVRVVNPRNEVIVAALDAGGPPLVQVFDAETGQLVRSMMAFNAGFMGGVRVALADINRDGVEDIVAAAGPGGGPHVRVFDGVTGAPLPGAIGSFFAYNPGFTGGVFVAGADVNGDGYADIVAGADRGGGPHVRVFSGLNGSELIGFFAGHLKFDGGVRVATGDINGDGTPDLITAPGAGTFPAEVHVFDGRTAQPIGGNAASILAYPGFGGGVYVASGDVDGDGRDDIITGAGAGGGPHVKVFSGVDGAEITSFFAYDAGFRGGVRVSVGDMHNDGTLEIVTGAGPGGGPHVRAFTLGGGEVASLFAFNLGFAGGVFVAGSLGAPAESASQFIVASHDNPVNYGPGAYVRDSLAAEVLWIGFSHAEQDTQPIAPANARAELLFSDSADEDWSLSEASLWAPSRDDSTAAADTFWEDLAGVAALA